MCPGVSPGRNREAGFMSGRACPSRSNRGSTRTCFKARSATTCCMFRANFATRTIRRGESPTTKCGSASAARPKRRFGWASRDWGRRCASYRPHELVPGTWVGRVGSEPTNERGPVQPEPEGRQPLKLEHWTLDQDQAGETWFGLRVNEWVETDTSGRDFGSSCVHSRLAPALRMSTIDSLPETVPREKQAGLPLLAIVLTGPTMPFQ